jgi:acid phosphatase class B
LKGIAVPTSMKKIVTDVVASLKKLPSPEKRGQTFWDYLKEQLYSESTWDKNDLNVIEKEINSRLNKLEKKDLTEMWKSTDKGSEKIDAEKKADAKEMKEDLTDEILGQVMDRMDDNYSSKESFFSQPETAYVSEKKNNVSDEDLDEDIAPGKIDDEEIDLDDKDIFDAEELDDEEDSSF